MLGFTFRHLRGIGPKKEVALWRAGVTSWQDLKALNGTSRNWPITLPTEPLEIADSERALERRNADFFVQRLPVPEHYRIAVAFPLDTIFLDLETTGLSPYYDYVTLVGWSLGTAYGVHVRGDNKRPLLDALSRAKAIVTFNGTLFDIPFLRNEFGPIRTPPAHIDLRYFVRRMGLSGGQKAIEKALGITRPRPLTDLDGECAPILWHQYRRGDLDALKLLISYNHADIEGLKQIFDYGLSRIVNASEIPDSLRPNVSFSKNASKVCWSAEKKKRGAGGCIHLRKYRSKSNDTIGFSDLSSTENLSRLRVVGIDLSGSEERPSGWCLLEGSNATTHELSRTQDLIDATLDAEPHLISIDSPLSLPAGRVTVDDDDPGRNEFGITRECERILWKRGISVYPCLIKSMQRLTQRGIDLASVLRESGLPVIESYPGAAQDIMNIPRKRAGLPFLTAGLTEFGITGEVSKPGISHDELDAITSALVGLFFWAGKFEALGNDRDDYLIVPDLSADTHIWLARNAIGISGATRPLRIELKKTLADQNIAYIVLPSLSDEPRRRTQARKKLSVSEQPLVVELAHAKDHALLKEIFGPGFDHICLSRSADRLSDTSSILASLAHTLVPQPRPGPDLIQFVDRLLHASKEPPPLCRSR